MPKGSTYGVMGRNGSGKSTALKLVAGITKPTSGTVRVEGRISALIELGAGFHPEISGRENVFINGIMLGLTKREIQERFDEIVDFAELREFIDAPVKTYSSGMYMRLGFAVAINVNPDVLLVDEVLAVGDEGFTHKCLDKFAEFKRSNKTILLVTHSLNLIERFCDEALWLDNGRAMSHGDPKRVVGAYLTKVEEGERSPSGRDDRQGGGERIARIDGAGRAGWAGRAGPAGARRRTSGRSDVEHVSGHRGTLGLARGGNHRRRAARPRGAAVIRVPLRRSDRRSREAASGARRSTTSSSASACSTRTASAATAPTPISRNWTPQRLTGEAEATFAIESLDLVEGTYKLDVAVHKIDGFPYDYHRLLYTFRVKSRIHDVGIYRPRHRWTFSPNVVFKPGTKG